MVPPVVVFVPSVVVRPVVAPLDVITVSEAVPSGGSAVVPVPPSFSTLVTIPLYGSLASVFTPASVPSCPVPTVITQYFSSRPPSRPDTTPVVPPVVSVGQRTIPFPLLSSV